MAVFTIEGQNVEIICPKCGATNVRLAEPEQHADWPEARKPGENQVAIECPADSVVVVDIEPAG